VKSCESDTWACKWPTLKCCVLHSERTPCGVIGLESGGLEIGGGCGSCAMHVAQREIVRVRHLGLQIDDPESFVLHSEGNPCALIGLESGGLEIDEGCGTSCAE
jgi:hypothetical protein